MLNEKVAYPNQHRINDSIASNVVKGNVVVQVVERFTEVQVDDIVSNLGIGSFRPTSSGWPYVCCVGPIAAVSLLL